MNEIVITFNSIDVKDAFNEILQKLLPKIKQMIKQKTK